ncbi:MAG: DUF3343 domain-containing protein [Syntrophomonas sp.]|uniref:DUF3343 domain-containing protein n=1 Tax=Syntrophomonas sp. TaxID=2053627 RepID=UPI0026144531|nr:DUF3343 domain-containing protein [Syntrophomonas sp.]MDD2509755.1 DUF3343 domain-containing protein [Syntrophomonas sp.]MDD3879503.1 DUF3343 domain-containing protein [Syntrophomonas sp.]MDD4625752.1 DUF3343 domain-containing protein [Syntrophomonas sp.]
MSNELLRSNNYALLTFAATSHALKAEKLLKSRQADFLVIPTLREISTSCGLSIKIAPVNLLDYYNYLSGNKIHIEGTYQVVKEGKKNRVEQIQIHKQEES